MAIVDIIGNIADLPKLGEQLGWAANLVDLGIPALTGSALVGGWYRKRFRARESYLLQSEQNARQELSQLQRAFHEQEKRIRQLEQASLAHVVKEAEAQRKDNNTLPETNLLMDWWKMNSAPLAKVARRLGELHAEHLERAALRQAVPYLTVAAVLNPGDSSTRSLLTEMEESLALSDDEGDEPFDIIASDGRYLEEDELRALLSV